MVSRIAFLLFTLCLATVAHALNFGTYNIRYDNRGDVQSGNSWALRAPYVAQIIRFHGFDVVGTQEGFQNQIDDLTRLMPEYAFSGAGRDDGKQAGEHIAIFYKKEKFRVLEEGHFWLSETPDQPSKGWDASLQRICAWAKFEELATKKTFFCFSVHFDHRGVEARKQSALLIIRQIEKITNGQPTVLCGDFNVDQTSESYQVLHETDGLLRDSFEISPLRLAFNGTPNGFDSNLLTESRIDHVFVTKHFSVSRYGILTDTFRTPKVEGSDEHTSANFPNEVKLKQYEARLPSDHFPVLVEATF